MNGKGRIKKKRGLLKEREKSVENRKKMKPYVKSQQKVDSEMNDNIERERKWDKEWVWRLRERTNRERERQKREKHIQIKKWEKGMEKWKWFERKENKWMRKKEKKEKNNK